MADETPNTDPQAGAEETPAAKPAARRGRAASAEPVADAAAEKPKRIRRPSKKTDDAPAAEQAPKPRRAGARAKASAEESVAAAGAAAESSAGESAAGAPKPRRIRARAAKAEPGAAEGAAKAPAAKAPAKKPPAAGAGAASRRLVPGRRRSSKDGQSLQPQLVYAHARYVRSSARKARIVCDHIRGKSVPEARAILAFAPRGVAKDWAKLLNSAVANAEHNHELIGDELHVKEVFADVGPTLKRFRPRAMGRATPINKRTAHLSITLAPKE
jgi:ribosomal protein L22